MSILFSKVEFKNILIKKKTFQNIYFSWGFKKNFDKNGNFKDRYTNKNISNFKNTLIFLIYLDNKLPNKVKPNTILVYKKKFLKNFNLIFFLEYLLKNINFKFFKKMSSFSSLSDQVIEFIEKIFHHKI